MPDHNDRFGDPSESVDDSPAGGGQGPATSVQQAAPRPNEASQLNESPQSYQAPRLNEAPQPTREPQPLDQFSNQKQNQPPWVWAGMGALRRLLPSRTLDWLIAKG